MEQKPQLEVDMGDTSSSSESEEEAEEGEEVEQASQNGAGEAEGPAAEVGAVGEYEIS